ncbi:MAG: SagB/ThcOx family dehydrogenase [Thiohalobacterales bacterium]|nr:SagB/ThcOx family dehydrogenase [Thiohalobacterales bacterium]
MRTILIILTLAISPVAAAQTMQEPLVIELPQPQTAAGMPVERTLRQRRSVRRFSDRPLELTDAAQLLWSAQGITSRDGLRTAPSAGALYPLEIYLAAGNVNGLPAGIWHYRPDGHRLVQLSDSDVRTPLARAALDQAWVREAAAVVVFAAVFERTLRKYGKRGTRYVHIEAGHAAQNLFLQAVSLDIRTVVVGAFRDADVAAVLDLPEDHAPLILMPLGH